MNADMMAQKAHKSVFDLVGDMEEKIPTVWQTPWDELLDDQKSALTGIADHIMNDPEFDVSEFLNNDMRPSEIFAVSLFCGTVRTQNEIQMRTKGENK